jgi:hypothetical protein
MSAQHHRSTHVTEWFTLKCLQWYIYVICILLHTHNELINSVPSGRIWCMWTWTIQTLYSPQSLWNDLYTPAQILREMLTALLRYILLHTLNMYEMCEAGGSGKSGVGPCQEWGSIPYLPSATSKGPWDLRSSFTVSKNSLPPAFSKAFPAKENSEGPLWVSLQCF